MAELLQAGSDEAVRHRVGVKDLADTGQVRMGEGSDDAVVLSRP